MKIIIDESVDYYYVSELKSRYFTVVSIIKEFASLADEEIVSMSLTPPAIIITEDKDFGELVFNKQLKVFAVILMRYDKPERPVILQRLSALLLDYSQDLPDSFSVITFNKTRTRKLDF